MRYGGKSIEIFREFLFRTTWWSSVQIIIFNPDTFGKSTWRTDRHRKNRSSCNSHCNHIPKEEEAYRSHTNQRSRNRLPRIRCHIIDEIQEEGIFVKYKCVKRLAVMMKVIGWKMFNLTFQLMIQKKKNEQSFLMNYRINDHLFSLYTFISSYVCQWNHHLYDIRIY